MKKLLLLSIKEVRNICDETADWPFCTCHHLYAAFGNFFSFLCCLSPELKNKLDCWTLKAMVKPQNIKAMLVVQWLLVTTVGSRLKGPGFDSCFSQSFSQRTCCYKMFRIASSRNFFSSCACGNICLGVKNVSYCIRKGFISHFSSIKKSGLGHP